MEMFKINLKNFNFYTVLSILFLLAGIIVYIMWGAVFGVWYDIGPYSLTIVLVLSGILGFIISLMDKKEEK